MNWDGLYAFGAQIITWTLLWALIAIPATLVLLGVARFLPTAPSEAARAILKLRPSPSGASVRFAERKANAQQKLELGTVRILLERKHNKLKQELAKIRGTLDRNLQQLTQASRSRSGTSLIDLLSGFKSDTDRALQFMDVEDGMVDRAVERRQALFAVVVLIVFLGVCAVANGMLLYVFFDESMGGQTIASTGLEVAVFLAVLFPFLEGAGGFAAEMIARKVKSWPFRLCLVVVILLALIAFVSFEYFVFYQLLGGAFNEYVSFPHDGWIHRLVSLIGPALVGLEAMFGYGIADNVLKLIELGTVKSIKRQIGVAQHFVNGLESRYDRIEESAARASASIDDFVAALKGRGDAEMSVASAIAEQRDRFVKAVDAVNPTKWKNEAMPAAGDMASISAYAWFLPFIIIILVGAFITYFASVMSFSGVVADHGIAPYLLSFGAAGACLLAGTHLFDRTTVAHAYDAGWRDILSPRDSAFRLASLIGIGAICLGVAWVCIRAHGLIGIAEGAILVGVLIALSWTSSFSDLALRGLAYLATIIVCGIALIATIGFGLSITGFLYFAAALAALLLVIVHLLAWPLTLVLSALNRSAGTAPQVA